MRRDIGEAQVKQHETRIKELITIINEKNITTLETAMIFLEKLWSQKGLSVTTRSTYMQTLLGALARRPELQYLDTTNLVRRVTPARALLRALEKEKRATPTTKARQMNLSDLLNISSSATPQAQKILLFGFFGCARVRNIIDSRNTLSVKISDEPSISCRINYFRHKTLMSIGSRAVTFSIPAPTSLLPWVREALTCSLPKEEFALVMIDNLLKETAFSRHSLRRGGAHYWYSTGMPVEKIRQLTLHTTLEATLCYILA